MSRSDFERLLEDLRKDHLLMADFRTKVLDPESAAQWARDKGYALGSEILTALAEGDRELSDDELEDAAGGDDAWGSGTGGSGGGTTGP